MPSVPARTAGRPQLISSLNFGVISTLRRQALGKQVQIGKSFRGRTSKELKKNFKRTLKQELQEKGQPDREECQSPAISVTIAIKNYEQL